MGLTTFLIGVQFEMEQDHGPCPHHHMSSACLLPVENLNQKSKFNQRNVEMWKQRKTVKRRLNNSNVIKHNQGSLVLSQGLQRIFTVYIL